MRIGLHEAEHAPLPTFAALLATFAGRVALCSRLADALALAASGDIDLLIYACASWDSTAAADCIALSAATSHVPLLVVVGQCDKTTRVDARRAGADDFVEAPFDVDELSVRAQTLVRRVSRSRAVQRGPLRVDLVKRSVSVDGRPLALTTREYDVVVHLAERADAIVSRDELSSALGAGARRSNHVAVHISGIRRELGRHASMIETVRGIGYRLRWRPRSGAG